MPLYFCPETPTWTALSPGKGQNCHHFGIFRLSRIGNMATDARLFLPKEKEVKTLKGKPLKIANFVLSLHVSFY